MASKLKGLFRPRKSRSPKPTSSSPAPGPSHEHSSQAAAPLFLPAKPSQIVDALPTTTEAQVLPVPISEGQNYGIKELHDGGTKASTDIVFVHGLTGNSYSTWLHKDAKVHWPSELLKQDIPDARILGFGYDADVISFWNPASNSRLSNHAENMVGALVRKRERTNTETRRILFVAHSLGGLVVEQALNHSRSAAETVLRQIERYTAGVVFLGVPHCGADLAAWASIGTRMANVLRRANKDIVGVLKPGSEVLRAVEKGFSSILSLRKEEGSQIFVTCFYEELPVVGVGEIVPLHSTEIKPYGCYGIHANHMDMTKFSSRNDKGYDDILGELQRWQKSINQKEALAGASSSASVNQGQNQFGATSAWNSQGPQSIFYSNNFNQETANLWLVPRTTSRLYTGRKGIGERLIQALALDPSSSLSRRIFAIVGLGGTGKSEVCLKFAEDHRDKYWGVFWLDATSNATADEGYINIGRRCGIPDPTVEGVKSWLEYNTRRWLLIIDNADDPGIDYSQHLPHGNNGHILLTSRNPECLVYGTVGSETLEDLEPDLARDLLLLASGIDQSQSEQKNNASSAIVKILGSHTLAIIQAGAFIRQKLCNLEQYPAIFQQEKGELLRFHSKQNVSIYQNVYATFEVSAKYLARSDLPEVVDALDLLHTIAFMDNSGILEVIFQRAAEYASQVEDTDLYDAAEVLSISLPLLTRLPEYAKDRNSVRTRLRWRKACAVLESLSIITTQTDDECITISVHSLVHAWAKERQNHESRLKAWQSAATVIALSCQGWYAYCPFFVLIQPHTRACVTHDIEGYTHGIPALETAQLLFQLAYILYATRDDTSLRLLVAYIRARLGRKSIDIEGIQLGIARFTGRVHEQQGDNEQAVKVYEDINKRQSSKLAEDPSRLASQHALAGAYRANGQIDEAVQLLEHVVKVKEKLAEDHPDRLASQHVLAGAYRANGQVKKAVELLKQVVAIREKVLAEDHSDRLISQHALTMLYAQQRFEGEDK